MDFATYYPIKEAESGASSTRSSFSNDELVHFRPKCSLTDFDAAELLANLHTASYPEAQPPKLPPPDAHKCRRAVSKKSKEPKICMDCGRTETCFWRRDKMTGLPLCNACGLYLAKHKNHRPSKLGRK